MDTTGDPCLGGEEGKRLCPWFVRKTQDGAVTPNRREIEVRSEALLEHSSPIYRAPCLAAGVNDDRDRLRITAGFDAALRFFEGSIAVKDRLVFEERIVAIETTSDLIVDDPD